MSAAPWNAPTVLAVAEAVPLGHALIDRVARDIGVRVLFIKGPSFTHHRLRPLHLSTDIDALVDPPGYDALVEALTALGFLERPKTRVAEHVTLHSTTLIHPEWPCDLDIHGFFPGFLAPPEEVFNVLWESRTVLPIAEVECHIPGLEGSLLVLALHSLRSRHSGRRHEAELQFLIDKVGPRLTAAERERVVALATKTGANATLASVLPLLGVDVDSRAQPGDDAALVDWLARIDGGASRTAVLISRLQGSTWRQRVAIVCLALWPSAADLRLEHPMAATGPVGLAKVRANRLWFGARALPRALAARRRARAMVGRDAHRPRGEA